MQPRFPVDGEEHILEGSLPGPSGRVTREDVVQVDDVEAGEEHEGDEAESLLTRLSGPLIAAATFVPTFLAVFLGLPYFLGGVAPASGPSAPGPPSVEVGSRVDEPPPSLAETIRDPFIAPRPADPPVASPSDRREAGEGPEVAVEHAPSSTAEPSGAPSLPPARPPRPAAAEARRDERDWTPAAAFRDREAAGRLAGSIERQGYPVEIRQDVSAPRPWVVWIGARPRAGERRP
jgi:hypothetical protein